MSWKWVAHKKHLAGYECSSAGDKRFSAFYARLPDGRTIEDHYQVDVKGYNSIKDGKGKPPLNNLTKDELWLLYKNLWVMWACMNKDVLEELREATKDIRILTDKFATSRVNQAEALAYILNETNHE